MLHAAELSAVQHVASALLLPTSSIAKAEPGLSGMVSCITGSLPGFSGPA